MGIRARIATASAFALAATLALAACTGPANSPSASSPASSPAASSASSVEPSGSSTQPSSSNTAPDATSEVTIPLDYAAGTGFEWTYVADPEGIVEETARTTEDLSDAKNVTGGPLRERITFRAVAPGEVVLTFALARSWEDADPDETQTYAFTVTDDLNMILNPYKSQFENEPE